MTAPAAPPVMAVRRWPGFTLSAVLTVTLIGVALFAGGRLVLAGAIYGTIALMAVGALRFAVKKGSLFAHFVAMAIVVAIGLWLTAVIDPRDPVTIPLPGDLERLIPFDALAKAIGFLGFRSSSILGEVFGMLWEILNIILVLLFVGIAFFCARFASFRFVSRVLAYFERELHAEVFGMTLPSLHNVTISAMFGLLLVLTGLAMLLLGMANAGLGGEWTEFATGFLWATFAVPTLHLSQLAQRYWPGQASDKDEAKAEEAAADAGTVMPVYERLVADERLGKCLMLHYVDRTGGGARGKAPAAEGPEGLTPDSQLAREALVAGQFVLQRGLSDRDFYRLFAAAVQDAENRGGSVLVICPNEAGEEVSRALRTHSLAFLPEVTRRSVDLTSRRAAFDGKEFYDLVLAEERQFYDVVLNQRGEFDLLWERLSLIVVADLHLIDACRLNNALAELAPAFSGRSLGVLCQSRWRRGLETQIATLFGRFALEGSRASLHQLASPSSTDAIACLCWRDSLALRSGMLMASGLGEALRSDSLHYDALPYVQVGGAPPEFPAAALEGLGRRSAADWGQKGATGLGGLIARTVGEHERVRVNAELLTHYAPRRAVRVSIVRDQGNIVDCLTGPYDFWHDGTDKLVHVVSAPYPGLEYLCDRLVAGVDYPRLLPMAQRPGLGLSEVALRIEAALKQEGGLDEQDLNRLLTSASGRLSTHLGLSATRRGLERLFQMLDPSFERNLITRSAGEDLYNRFSLDRNHRIGGITRQFEVIIEGEGTPLGLMSPRDEGLIFAPTSVVRWGEQFIQIEEVRPDLGAITATRVGRDEAAPTRLFRRTYDVDFTEDFASENHRIDDQSDAEGMVRMHVHATVRRHSDSVITWPEDEPLFASGRRAPGAHNPDRVDITQRRPFRSLVLLAIRLTHETPDPLQRDAIGRTLTASLQDVLGIAFPVLARRIAVAELRAEDDKPWLRLGYPVNTLAYRYPSGTATGAHLDQVAASIVASNKVRPPAYLGGTAGTSYDIAIIEDADSDIGVSRAVFDLWETAVLPAWRDYLEWASRRQEWSGQDGVFDVPSVLEFPFLRGGG